MVMDTDDSVVIQMIDLIWMCIQAPSASLSCLVMQLLSLLDCSISSFENSALFIGHKSITRVVKSWNWNKC